MNNIGLTFKGESWAEIFEEIRKAMLTEAKTVPSRIGKTKELLNPTIVLSNPRKRLFYNEHRTFNLAYALVEAFFLFNSQNYVSNFSFYNKRMSDYSDDGIHINSAYGYHIADSLEELVNKLKEDSHTRQAVLNIYSTKYGVKMKTKDVPCTIALNFLIRDGKLNLTTYMRSNDLFWGLQYDLFMFTCLQEVIANELGLEMGYYIHCPTSLHVYDYHWELLEKINKENTEDFGEFIFNYKIKEAVEASNKIIELANGAADSKYSYNDLKHFDLRTRACDIYTIYNSINPLVLVEIDGNIRNENINEETKTNIEYIKNSPVSKYFKRWYKWIKSQSNT